MPICPKCKTEYREGFKVCSDCNVELQDNLPVEMTNDVEAEKMNGSEEEWVFFKNVSDGYEGDTILSLLESNNISYVKKQKGTGGYLKIITGTSYYGTDLYIPKSQLMKAQEVIEVLDYDSESVPMEKDEISYEKSHIKKTRVIRWFILCFFVVPAALFFAIAIIRMLIELFRLL